MGLKNKKGEISVEVLFYIFMGLLFAWLLIYGIQNIMLVEDEMSSQDLIQIREDLEAAIHYCNDPLNEGNVVNERIDHRAINSMCILVDEDDPTDYDHPSYEDIYQAGDNVVLINAQFQNSDTIISDSINVIESFSVSQEMEDRVEDQFDSSECFPPNEDDSFDIRITC